VGGSVLALNDQIGLQKHARLDNLKELHFFPYLILQDEQDKRDEQDKEDH
jgi:hypothetical protein